MLSIEEFALGNCLGPRTHSDRVAISDVTEILPDLFQSLSEEDPEALIAKIEMVAACGPFAAPALPRLRELLRDPETEKAACEAIEAIGPKARAAIPDLLELLHCKRSGTRFAAAKALWEIRRHPAAVSCFAELVGPVELTYVSFPRKPTHWAPWMLPHVQRPVSHRDPSLPGDHLEIYDVLIFMADELGPAAAPAIPNIISALEYGLPEERAFYERFKWYCLVLESLGSDARPAVPVIVQFLPKDRYWYPCLRALESIGPGADAALPWLIEQLRKEAKRPPGPKKNYDDDETLLCRVICTLGAIGPAAKEVVPDLIALLDHELLEVRNVSATALGKIGPSAKAAIPLIEPGLDDPHKRFATAVTLWRIERNDVRLLIAAERLFSESLGQSIQTATELGKLGPDAQAAVPALDIAMRGNSKWLSVAAAESLWRITKDRHAIELLESTLEAKNEASGLAADALVRIDGRTEARDFLHNARYHGDLRKALRNRGMIVFAVRRP
jgi:HEAT repeat protein